MRFCIPIMLVLATGCSTYESQPLDERALLDELRAIEVVLPADGLDPDQAIALALVHNPDLAVWRRDHEIAEGLVISEAAWANPEFRPSLQNLYSRAANPITFALDLRVFPPIPGETAAKTARAEARERRVLAEIEDHERRLAVETRIAHARLVMIDSQLSIAGAVALVHERIVSIVEQQVEAGAATQIDGSLVSLQRDRIDAERQLLVADREAAQAGLAHLLGASPLATIVVRSGAGEPATPDLDQSRLEDLALASRPDLRALVESYDESEHELELVHLSHAFWPRFMQLAVGGLTSRTNVGLDGGIELPIFDSGAADIAVAEARRGRARATYRAALHGLRSEIRQAVLAYQEQQRRRRFLSDRLEPSLQQAEELLRTGFESGAIDPLKLVDIETRVWDARRAGTEATFGLEQARAHLAATIGRVFESR